MIAKLRGHKNNDPPSICYISHSNVLVSAEKHYSKRSSLAKKKKQESAKKDKKKDRSAEDPDHNPSHLTDKNQKGTYESFSELHNNTK